MRDTAIVNYHIKSAGPQAFHFDVDGVVGNLVSHELVPTEITVLDQTPALKRFKWADEQGAQFDMNNQRGWEAMVVDIQEIDE